MCLCVDTCYSSSGAQHRKCHENSPQVRLKEERAEALLLVLSLPSEEWQSKGPGMFSVNKVPGHQAGLCYPSVLTISRSQ
jgi:hypothetical protein